MAQKKPSPSIHQELSLNDAISMLQKLRDRVGNIDSFLNVTSAASGQGNVSTRPGDDPGFILSLVASEGSGTSPTT
jgi:hypothetical protein